MVEKTKEPEILTPRYVGVTSENVGRTLLKHRPEDNDDPEPEPTDSQSGI